MRFYFFLIALLGVGLGGVIMNMMILGRPLWVVLVAIFLFVGLIFLIFNYSEEFAFMVKSELKENSEFYVISVFRDGDESLNRKKMYLISFKNAKTKCLYLEEELETNKTYFLKENKFYMK